MRSLALTLVAVALVAVASGCVFSQAPVMCPFLQIDVKGGVAVGDPGAGSPKTGTSEAKGIILASFGDASISAAAKNGNITRIHHVDSESMNILSIYASYKTIVYGE
jgi:hypothetical protein